ncbi:MAG: hypothetical protein MGG11_12670 [Trichodesmium sp. MAG_R03]|nr:hypothetical protein [Trichodesmium sp. MAG_R03]
MNDQYQRRTKFYSDVVQKNRNYYEIATKLAQIIGDARDLLDIGIGTDLIYSNPILFVSKILPLFGMGVWWECSMGKSFGVYF